jgi:teichuronic acid biosynthesis glycosyltransferase TuaG
MGSSVYDSGLVSIITPVFNSACFVAQTIDSVVGQIYGDWEMLLIDDCSSDSSADIIKQYVLRDKRIRYIRLDQNMGAAAARNRGLDEALGRYIAFVDADDLWMADKLEEQLKLIKQKNAGLTFTAIEIIDENGNVVKTKRHVRPVIDYKFLLSNTMIACSSVVVDRMVTGDFRMPLVRKGQDYATWLRIMRGGLLAYGIDEALVRYRLVQGSISSNRLGALKRTWHIYRDQEHLSAPRSIFYFSLYTWHAIKKYMF